MHFLIFLNSANLIFPPCTAHGGQITISPYFLKSKIRAGGISAPSAKHGIAPINLKIFEINVIY